jgi:lycopene beta-cyclase
MAVRAALGPIEILRASVAALGPTHVILDSGERIEAAPCSTRAAARPKGWSSAGRSSSASCSPFRRATASPDPIVMDATVEQHDGYRFVYCLPFSPTELFVEDTYYSDGPEIDRDLLRDRIGDYAAAQGWQIAGAAARSMALCRWSPAATSTGFWPKADPVARAGPRRLLPSADQLLAARRGALRLLAGREAPLDARLAAATRARAARTGRRRLLPPAHRLLFHAAEPHINATGCWSASTAFPAP